MTPDAPTLEFATDDSVAGFRLDRLELLNWGTFDRKVWTLSLGGHNTLLTGDIGSGKSTLVDAVTTLLVPAHRVAYNKAAGADGRERSLRSYVLGHYKSGRNDVGGSSRPIALRDASTLSVILGEFRNEAFGQVVTLAQVFWFKDATGQPARLFVATERDLSIAEHFTGFNADIAVLRKRLRGLGAEVNDSFPAYGAWFRRRLGIASEQALELFHQTVSMKSVGNLTDFVRQHMLDAGDSRQRIEALLDHFEDLNRAHEAVLRAKRQMDLLTPLVADCDTHDADAAGRAELEAARDALHTNFAEIERGLLNTEIAALDDEHSRRDGRRQQREAERRTLAAHGDRLRLDIAANGGDRLGAIETEVEQFNIERDKCKRRADEYRTLCSRAGVPVAEDVEAFVATRQSLEARQQEVRDREDDLQNSVVEHGVELKTGKGEHDEREIELRSLRSRTSNIPHEQIRLRTELCDALVIDPAEVPFAGELLQVRADERAWEGAIERVLRSFGQSLLVPDDRYADVQRWVDGTNLRGRFVYFRVRDGDRRALTGEQHRDSLVHKVEVLPSARHGRWLHDQLARRFDLACCATPEQFRRETQALTRHGQVKGRNERHEKDDRTRIDDRSRYVLGWSNADKVAALEAQQATLAERLASIGAVVAELLAEAGRLRTAGDQLSKLTVYSDFSELDWETPTRRIAELGDERDRLLKASDTLVQLQDELNANTGAVEAIDARLTADRDELVKLQIRREGYAERRLVAEEVLTHPDAPAFLACRPVIEAARTALGLASTSLRSLDADERVVRGHLQGEIDAAAHRIDRTAQRIVKQMQTFRTEFPAESTEIDAEVASADGFREILERLATDDLPRHEARFKQLLNENTIREIANFQSQLVRQQDEIRERIEAINHSLTQIDYNPGRFISLEPTPNDDAEVREFRADLRSCTEGSLSGSDDPNYAEVKFLQVRDLIERFRGRDGITETDRRWTAKVTDVRNWFTFAASERWREDGTEHEHYSDSSGKSGGQKEKLAYTVLAASLAYQFGLEFGEVRSRSFRFVVIDEAFGRGSDDSARFGLELFAKLNLQLLVVTPMQKIHVIEPFVRNVGFVHNEAGEESRLRNLTIEEYHHEKQARRAAPEP